LGIEPIFCSVKNVIGRDGDKFCGCLTACGGEIPGPVNIDAIREFLVRFGTIDVRISGAVYDSVGLMAADGAIDGVAAGYVEIGSGEGGDVVAKRRAMPGDRAGDHPVRTCYQDLHLAVSRRAPYIDS